MHVHVCICEPACRCSRKPKAWTPPGAGVAGHVGHPVWVLGTKLGSSVRAVLVLTCWVSSPALVIRDLKLPWCLVSFQWATLPSGDLLTCYCLGGAHLTVWKGTPTISRGSKGYEKCVSLVWTLRRSQPQLHSCLCSYRKTYEVRILNLSSRSCSFFKTEVAMVIHLRELCMFNEVRVP